MILKHILRVVLVFAVFWSLPATGWAEEKGLWQWAQAGGGRDFDFAAGVATSPDGGVVLAGGVTGNVTLWGQQLSPAPGLANGQFIAKFDSTGKAKWVKSNPFWQNSPAIVTSPAGEIYWGLEKFSAEGMLLSTNWLGLTAESENVTVDAIAVDRLGNVACAGRFLGFGSGSIGSLQFTNGSTASIYFATYTSDGHHTRVRGFDQAVFSTANPPVLCAAASGGFWLGVTAVGTANLGSVVLHPTTASQAVVVRLSAIGNIGEAGIVAEGNTDRSGFTFISKLSAGSDGSVAVAGTGWEEEQHGFPRQFVSLLDGSGRRKWFVPVQDLPVTDLNVDPGGGITLAGVFYANAAIGAKFYKPASYLSLYIARLSPGGILSRFDQPAGATLRDTSYQTLKAVSMAGDGTGNIYIAGNLDSKTSFEGNPLEVGYQPNDGNLFLAKWDIVPAITHNSGSFAVLPGESTTLWAEVAGRPPFYFQWYKGSSPIEGATNSSFAISPVGSGDDADYHVEVWNSELRVIGRTAHVYVLLDALPLQHFARITVTGVPGKTYAVQISSDPSADHWTTAATVTLTSSTEVWTDPQPTTGDKKFYRTVPQP
ncbi:MAG TPA: immunoglobulin domain-containing protein [Candidatus Limnocylindria bacterium]|jgi:hypothetical protein|nr:immunoglobulin domain-containing protein [Candidatus Limnocylindria bacterium]